MFVAFPRTVQDVQRCLQCSLEHAVPCVVKCGGHSLTGYSTIEDGFVINLSKMNSVSVGSGTVVVQAGALWKDVYGRMGNQLVTGGLCPSVGVGGLTLGGGYSGLSRKYGLVIDNVISMTMVTASGDSVVVANDSTNADLFWALRGGGGGNFGVVTEFTFKTHPADYSSYVFGSLHFEAGAKSQEALTMIGKMNLQLPWEMYLDIAVSADRELSVFTIYLGSYSNAVKILQPLIDMSSGTSFINFNSYYSLIDELAKERGYDAKVSGVPVLLRGCIYEALSENLVETLFNLDTPGECTYSFMHVGGAVGEFKSDETAYFHRSGEFENYIVCEYKTEEHKERVEDFVDDVFTILEDGGYCIGNYVNDLERQLLNWQEKYYGANYQRLLDIKNRWNPVGSGYFHFPQEIGSSYSFERKNVPSEKSEL